MNLKRVLVYLMFALLVTSCGYQGKPQIAEIEVELIEVVPREGMHDNPMHNYIEFYKSVKDEMMGVVIGNSASLMKVEQPEGLLNNLIADVLLDFANTIQPTDFALTNIGGIRRDLYEGPITVSDIYEILPFDNTLVILGFTGKQIQQIADIIAQKGGASTSGISFEIDDDEADDVLINGVPLDENKIYYLVTNDYLSYGNDYFTPLGESISRLNLPDKMRDVMIRYVISQTEKNQPVRSSLKNEIYVED